MQVKIEGLRELDKALGELAKATARNTLNRALMRGAKDLEAAWEPQVPKLTGALGRSINVGKSNRLTGPQRKYAKKEGTHFAEVHIGSADPAAMQQEFGNMNHPAQPHGRPTWESKKMDILDNIGHDLKVEIEKSAKRNARRLAKAG